MCSNQILCNKKMIVQFKKNENSDKRKQIKADLQTLIIKVIYQEYTLSAQVVEMLVASHRKRKFKVSSK